MFPTLNFKHIRCPLFKNCKNGPFCLFSHSSSPNKRPAVPIQSQPKRVHSESSSVKNDKIIVPQIKREIIPTKVEIIKPKPQQKIEIDPSARPIIATDIYGKVPKLKRQKVLDKLYEEFLRIYTNLPKSIAYEHSLKQEEFIYANSTVQSYISKATSIFTRLKKRPLAKHEGDVGIDGEWKESEIESIPLSELNELIMSNLELIGYDYPSGSLLKLTNVEKQQNPKKQCERCGNVYTPVSNPSQTECNYHWGKLVSGSGERAFTCCQSSIGSVGCSQGPHVFKDQNDIDLHSKIPFDEAPYGNGKDVVALDCEMSFTLGGLELVRLSIIDWYGNILLDEIIRPLNEIICHNTRFSGIKEILPDAKTLSEVKPLMYEIIKKNTIIIGHGLENDLRQLRMIHENVIDTAQVFPHPKGLPYRHSLKMLVERNLGRFIQTGEHDSFEDARACIDLLKRHIHLSKK